MGCCLGGLHETSIDPLATTIRKRCQNKAQGGLSAPSPLIPRKHGPPTVPLLYDLWFEVLLFLNLPSVAKVFRVCSVLRDFCEEQALWRAFILREGEQEGRVAVQIAAQSTNVIMDYYWLYRVRWCVRNWGLPANRLRPRGFVPWPEDVHLIHDDHGNLTTRTVDSTDHTVPSLVVTRITMGRCCRPRCCLIISTEEKLNDGVHLRTFHTKFDDRDVYREWYLNLALRSAQCPLREPLCFDPKKDPYAKGLSEEVLEMCRTHAILPRDFCRLRDALQREAQFLRDSQDFLTGHELVGPVKMCEDVVWYHGRTLGRNLDLVQAAHLWRAYVKLGLIYHDKPKYPFLLLAPTCNTSDTHWAHDRNHHERLDRFIPRPKSKPQQCTKLKRIFPWG